MKTLILFFVLIFSFKCPTEFQMIQAKYYPETNTIEYNGQKFEFSSFLSPSAATDIKEIKSTTKIKPPKSKEPKEEKEEEEEYKAIPGTGAFWFNLIGFIILACFAGTMSGLTVGYLSIDSLILEIKMSNGTESEKSYAAKIYRLVENHHWLLVTLLLCNSFACEAMPIFLSKLVNEMMAVILSVTVLLFVGEIIPQALCTGPNQMKIASFLAPFTYLLMWITYPISYPIAMFMDCIIGVQGKSRFCNSDLKSLIDLHMSEIMGSLSGTQLGYFTGFLDVFDKKVKDLILPMDKVMKIDYQANLTKVTLKRLIDSGYSRFPVYKKNPNNLIGILRMKQLLGKDLSKPTTLEQLGVTLTSPIIVGEDCLFLDLFEKFKGGKSHMAFIFKKEKLPEYFRSENYQFENKTNENSEPSRKYKGIVTLEDLIEFWLKISILDEEDYRQNKAAMKRRRTRKSTILDLFNNQKLHSKLNELYDSTRTQARNKTIREDNLNMSYNNNYHAYNDQNDDESSKLVFNNNN
jgi:CBS domain containing-hemolysin-like protein